MFSFSNCTSMPSSRSRRTAVSVSSVFRAKREMLLVSMMSICPASHSAIRRWNSVRSVLVPLMPLSAAVQKGLINLRRTKFPAQGLHQRFDLIGKVQPDVHAPVRVDGDGL